MFCGPKPAPVSPSCSLPLSERSRVEAAVWQPCREWGKARGALISSKCPRWLIPCEPKHNRPRQPKLRSLPARMAAQGDDLLTHNLKRLGQQAPPHASCRCLGPGSLPSARLNAVELEVVPSGLTAVVMPTATAHTYMIKRVCRLPDPHESKQSPTRGHASQRPFATPHPRSIPHEASVPKKRASTCNVTVASTLVLPRNQSITSMSCLLDGVRLRQKSKSWRQYWFISRSGFEYRPAPAPDTQLVPLACQGHLPRLKPSLWQARN